MTHAAVKRVKGIETVSKWSASFTDTKTKKNPPEKSGPPNNILLSISHRTEILLSRPESSRREKKVETQKI